MADYLASTEGMQMTSAQRQSMQRPTSSRHRARLEVHQLGSLQLEVPNGKRIKKPCAAMQSLAVLYKQT